MDTLVQRVAARYAAQVTVADSDDDSVDQMVVVAARFEMQREHYLPPEARAEKPLIPEGTDLEIWTWDGTRKTSQGEKPVFYGAAFAGKANKPLWHYAFGTQSNRIEEIRKTIEARKQVIDRKKKEQEEKRNFVHGLKVGDILYSSWGYDQTNVDFYQIKEVRGKNVIIQEIGKTVVEGEGSPSERVTADPAHVTGAPMLKRPQGSGKHVYVKVHSSANAYPWDGKPLHQTGWGYGH